MPEVVYVFYAIDKNQLIVEKFEYRRGRRGHDLLRVSADGDEIHFPLDRTDSPDGFLRRDGRWIGIAGAAPTAVDDLAKIRSDLETRAQGLRAKSPATEAAERTFTE